MIVKFIYAKNIADFENKYNSLPQGSVVFIEDTKQIWTQGQFYSCPYSATELQQLFGNRITALEELIVKDGSGDLFLADDGEYKKVFVDLSKYLTISKASDTYLTIEDAEILYQHKGDYIDSLPVADGSDLGCVVSGGDVNIINGVMHVQDDSHNHTISNIDDLQDILDEKVPVSRTINGKGLHTNITLTASDINADPKGSAEDAVLESKEYTDSKIAELVGQAPEVMDTIYELAEAMEANQSLVDILNKSISNKVDKEEGKELSSNDYTDVDKLKVNSITENAEENQNAFSNIIVGGTRLIAAEDKTDSFGLLAGKNIELQTNGKNITISGASYAVTNNDPTLSWGAKSVVGVVDGVSLTVNMPSNPENHYITGIRAGRGNTAFNESENDPYIKVIDNNIYRSQIRLIGKGSTDISTDDEGNVTIHSIKYELATPTQDGLLSSEDKGKLDGIEPGAQVNTVLGVKGNDETNYRIGNVNITKDNIGLGNVDNTSDISKPISNATQKALDTKAPLDSPALTGTPTAPTVNAGTNNTQIATTAFVQKEISNKIAAADAMIYKGTIGSGGTITALPNNHLTGWTYKVITKGTYAGVPCEIGDMIICLTDGTSANNSHWTVVQTNIDGAVIGPTSATNGAIALFDGTTGKLIKNSNIILPSDPKFTDTTYSFSANNPTLQWGTESTIGTAGGTTYKVKMPANPNTDTKVTNADNHYSPVEDTSKALNASGATATDISGNTVQVITGIKRDAKGHIVGITSGALKSTNSTSFTITANAQDDDIVVLSGTNGTNAVTYKATHAAKGPANGYTSGNTTTSISGGSGTIKIPQITVDKYGHVTSAVDESITITSMTYSFANGTGGFTVTPSGGSAQTVSIGKPSTAGTSDAVVVTNSDTNSTYRMLFHSGNNIYSTAGVYCNPNKDSLHATHFYETSDANFKTNIQLVLDSENMPIVKQFDWKKDGTRSFGFIAQELEEQGYPELVHTREDGVKTVDYSAALSLTMAKMQKKILELEQKIVELERKLDQKN